MKIVRDSQNKLVLKEITSNVIYRTAILFLAGLSITINGARNINQSSLSIFIMGPLLMTTAFVLGMFFFRITTIIFDANETKITRYVRKSNKAFSEKIIQDNISSVLIVPQPKMIGDIFKKRKADLYLEYEDGDNIKLNYEILSEKNAINCGYKIATFYNIPMKKVK